MGRREFKKHVSLLLQSDDFAAALKSLEKEPASLLCSALISFLPSADETLRSRAVAALGAAVARLAESNLEAAREIVRRLNWSLTEDSGAIGWGAPEAIGEICARHEGMAAEYGPVLLSYIGGPNHLGNPVLLRGALWGIGRLAETRPDILRGLGVVEKIAPYLESHDPDLSRLARHVLSCLDPDAGGCEKHDG